MASASFLRAAKVKNQSTASSIIGPAYCDSASSTPTVPARSYSEYSFQIRASIASA
jgi:hypothetical protein